MPKPAVFISHSHLDNDWCLEFASALQRRGYDAWYDKKGLTGGVQWIKTIERELQNREIFAIVVTPNSWASEWVQNELQLAFTTHRRIMPVILKAAKITGFLNIYQHIDVIGASAEVAASQFDAEVESNVPVMPGNTAMESGYSPGPLQSGIVEGVEHHGTIELTDSLVLSDEVEIYGQSTVADHRALGRDATDIARNVVQGEGGAVGDVEHGFADHVPRQYRVPTLTVIKGNADQQRYELKAYNQIILSGTEFGIRSYGLGEGKLFDPEKGLAHILQFGYEYSLEARTSDWIHVKGKKLRKGNTIDLSPGDEIALYFDDKLNPFWEGVGSYRVTLRFDYT